MQRPAVDCSAAGLCVGRYDESTVSADVVPIDFVPPALVTSMRRGFARSAIGIVVVHLVQVHRHEPGTAGGPGLASEQAAGESIDVTERIKTKHSSHLLPHGAARHPGGQQLNCAVTRLALMDREC